MAITAAVLNCVGDIGLCWIILVVFGGCWPTSITFLGLLG